MADQKQNKKDVTYKDINHVNNFICQNHDDIKFLCNDILGLLELELDNKDKIKELIEIILDRTKQAKYQGIRMEKRLNKYRKTIEKLGYIRVDKNNL